VVGGVVGGESPLAGIGSLGEVGDGRVDTSNVDHERVVGGIAWESSGQPSKGSSLVEGGGGGDDKGFNKEGVITFVEGGGGSEAMTKGSTEKKDSEEEEAVHRACTSALY
jgi:hypothetical protein